MRSFVNLLILGALGASSLLSSPAGAGKAFRKTKKSGKRKWKGRNPRKAEGRGRCPSGLSILDLVVCASGASGYDRNHKDFDILRELVVVSGIDLAPLSGVTVFAPDDGAFHFLAMELGYTGGGYDEEATFSFLAAALGGLGNVTKVVTDVLLYHVATEVLTLRDLRKEIRVTTALPTEGANLFFESEKPWWGKARGKNRVMLKHKDPKLTYPKVSNVLRDIVTSQGLFHVIKGVLSPAVLTGFG